MDKQDVQNKYDIAIVGAGPAGSSAAIRLANAGRSVLLIDRSRFPRHKLCGEFVSPECLEHLKDLGVMPAVEQAHPHPIQKTVFFSSGGRSFSVDSRWLAHNNGESIGLSRQSLDQILVGRAIGCGATVETEVSVVDVAVAKDAPAQLVLRSADGSIHKTSASIVIDATGRGRYIARKFDKPAKTEKPRQVAFKAHFRGASIEPGACEIFSYTGGYGGCSQVEDGLYNLCFIVEAALVRSIGSDPSRVLERTLLRNKRASQVLADIQVEGDWISVPIARYGSMDPAPAAGILAVGDAAAFIDPFTGSGIAMALQSSRLACNAIMERTDRETVAAAYRRSHASTFQKRLRVCRALRFFSGSSKVADTMIAGLACSSAISRYLARLTRTATGPKTSMP